MSNDTATSKRSSSLLSASAVMAAGTGLSRILGFVRAILIAIVLGNSTRQVDMFTIANTIPTSLYILFAGGALNTVLVPQIVRAMKNDPDGGEAYTNRIMTAFLAIIAGITLVVTIGAPLVMRLYSSDEWRAAALAPQYESMIALAYLCLPQIFFYGAFFLAGQVLNARGRFGPMMWAPIANNIVSIAIFVAFLAVWGNDGDHMGPFSQAQVLMLGGGSTLGIVVQAAILIPYLRAAGFHYRPRFDFRRTGLRHTFSLAKWTLGFVAVNQIVLVLINRLGSRATVDGAGGGIAAYNNAYLLWILPHSLITISLATAMLPQASRMAADGDLHGVRRETVHTIKLATTLLLPASIAFIVLADPITRLPFGNGRGIQDYMFVAWALIAFALGLVPFTVQYICLRAFYALEDTRSTFFLQLIIGALNAVLAVFFVVPVNRPALVAAGLALAYSLSYAFGVLISFRWLQNKLPKLAGGDILRHLARVTIAFLPGAAAAWFITWGLGRWSDSLVMRAVALVLAAVVAIGVYLVMGRLLRIQEVTDIVAVLRRRGRGGATDGGTSNAEPQTDALEEATGPLAATDLPDPDTAEHTVGGPATQTYDPFSDGDTVLRDGGGSPPSAELDTHLDDALDDDRPTDGGPAGGEHGGTSDRGDREAPPDPSLTREPVDLRGSHVRAGQVLAGRYRLEEVIAGRSNTFTWKAFDQVLSRAVLCHVLPPDDPRAPELLEAARKSAVATDSRFLRVLDAVHSSDPELGSYIVCEYAPGQSVELLLSHGPFSSLEAAWLTRELADALSAMHAQGLYHRRINPDTVVITHAGNVKIVGFLLEAAMFPETGRDESDPEATDVHDLGRMLYATLVSRWPGGQSYGLAKAPTDGGRLLTPRQVRAGVSPALDVITDQILGNPPRGDRPRLSTANDVVLALSKVLGSADASHDLERRVRQPVPVVGGDPDDPITETLTRVPATPVSASSANSPSTGVQAATRAGGSTRAMTERRPESNRRWLLALVGLLLLALLIGLVGVGLNQGLGTVGNPPATSTPSPSPTPTSGPLRITGGTEFDPEGDRTENHELVPRAFDGNPLTRWQTVQYRGNPRFGGLKNGVGLIVDLGSPQAVREVNVLLSGQGTAARIMVPDDLGVSTPPMRSAGQWRSVSSKSGLGRDAKFTFDPVTTRFVMVYLTSLPREGNNYQGGIYEIEVAS